MDDREKRQHILIYATLGFGDDMYDVIRELADRGGVPTTTIIRSTKDAHGWGITHYCAKLAIPRCRGKLMQDLLPNLTLSPSFG